MVTQTEGTAPAGSRELKIHDPLREGQGSWGSLASRVKAAQGMSGEG